MPSPFPGMNPYLEQADAWQDFHSRFIVAIADFLAPQVDPRYIVKIEEQLYIHYPENESRQLLGRSEVSVRPVTGSESGTATAVLANPTEVQLPEMDVNRIARVEIRDRNNRMLITVLELLSPSNKNPGPDRNQYLVKRAQVMASWVNLVEIDLLRGGPRMPMTPLPSCDYCILVSRLEDRPRAGLWPVRLRDPLPIIPVPLRPTDVMIPLDLQPLLHKVYDAGRYQTWIHTGQPTPPLAAEDAAWAKQFLPPTPG